MFTRVVLTAMLVTAVVACCEEGEGVYIDHSVRYKDLLKNVHWICIDNIASSCCSCMWCGR